ncbi:MAG: cell division protein FtsW [Bacteroidetes bacterium]|nr:cell division protein FtsW [Bacteroidota bacterium]
MSALLSINLRGDRYIWLIAGLLMLASTLLVYSATGSLAHRQRNSDTEYFLFRHIGISGLGLILMFAVHHIPYKYFGRIAQFGWIPAILLLLYTLMKGTEMNDASRWVEIPLLGVSFQSSEWARFAIVLFLARFLSRHQEEIDQWKAIFLPLILPVGLTFLLIAPDNLSSAALFLLVVLLMLGVGSVRFKHLFVLIFGCAFFISTFVAITYHFDWFRSKTWVSRIETFLSSDLSREPEQITHARIAIVTGGLLGKGPGKSTQRNFLPQAYNDFIYATLLEEYGIVGGSVICILYLGLLFRVLRAIHRSDNLFGSLLAAGLTMMLTVQALANMAVAVGLVPVTGQSLPLVSWGGTSVLFTCISLGIILSVCRDANSDPYQERQHNTTDRIDTSTALPA